ncbi:MAG: hypothetical protein JSV86_10410 [Gemmatimonadota bacterium]|nr:MAG: hypothetical protein JSV86_10410 [Gemmatimonadota bacterium]
MMSTAQTDNDVRRGPDASPNCAECPFAAGGKPNRPVRGIGPDDAAAIVVGEGPGRNEVEAGIPFVGASGRMLDQALRAVKIERSSLWITNATLCIPPPGAGDAKKKAARQCCEPRLHDELRSLPKLPILALGGVAAQGFLGDKFSISKLAGSVHEVDIDGRGDRPVIPTIHPAAILRGGDGASGAHAVDLLFWNLLYDVAKVKRVASGENVMFSDDIATEADDPSKAHELVLMFAQTARTERIMAIDAETVGTDGHLAIEPMYAKLTAIGMATPKLGVSVAYSILRPLTKKVIASLMADSTIEKVMHNRMYDTQVFARHNMPARGVVDCTLLMHHSAFPGLAHDLQRVTTQFFCIGPWKAEFRGGKGGVDELLTYNARDALATARLRAPLRNCLKASGSDKTYDIDIKMAEIAAHMSEVGVPINREVNTAMQVRFNKVLDDSMAQLRELVYDDETFEKFKDRLAAERAKRRRKSDPPDYLARHAVRLVELDKEIEKGKFEFSIGNADHVAAYLKARGVSLYQQTAKGKTSTKREVLEAIAHVPEVAAIVDFREAAKMNSTFVAKLPHYMDDNDRIHPVWSVNKITGRWGAEHPNCFDGATEILTERGWVRFDELPRDVRVAQYDKTDESIQFVTPTDYVHYTADEMIRMAGRYVDLYVTPDHGLLYRRRSGSYVDVQAGDYSFTDTHDEFIHAGNYAFGDEALNDSLVTLLCAAQADGTWNGSGWDFQFTKQRKVDRLVNALESLNLAYTLTERWKPSPFTGQPRRRVRIYVKKCPAGSRVADLLGGRAKQFGSSLLTLTRDTVEVLIDEIVYWDGNTQTGCEYYSSIESNADWVQALAALCGRRTVVRRYTRSPIQKKPNWQVRFSSRAVSNHSSATCVERVQGPQPVYCVTVPSGYVVVRRDKKVIIASNCMNWPKADPKKNRPNLREQVVAPPGRKIVGADFAQLEARIIALLSGDAFLVEIFANNKDIHSEFARIVWPTFDSLPVDQRKQLRDMIKRPEYCLAPGSRVLTQDLRWVPIETLREGDDLLAFTEPPIGRPWRRRDEPYFAAARVNSVRFVEQPAYRVSTTQGDVVASDEHLWIGRMRADKRIRSKKRYACKAWVRTDELRPGDLLSFTTEPWTEDRSWGAGYLAGAYDGEGNVGHRVIGLGQKPNELLDTLIAEMAARAFRLHTAERASDAVVRTEIQGGLWEMLRFLGTIRPRRLLANSNRLWNGCRLRDFTPNAKVLSVEPIGMQPLVALETTTGTFIAEGFLHHNCALYGGSVQTMIDALTRDYPEISAADVHRMNDLMKSKMTGVEAWHQQLLRDVATKREMRSFLYGRRRCFPLGNAEESTVFNFGVQATGADFMDTGLLRVVDALPDVDPTAEVILQVHDAIYVECDEDKADDVCTAVSDNLTQEHTHNGVTIHFPADAKIGDSWDKVS